MNFYAEQAKYKKATAEEIRTRWAQLVNEAKDMKYEESADHRSLAGWLKQEFCRRFPKDYLVIREGAC